MSNANRYSCDYHIYDLLLNGRSLYLLALTIPDKLVTLILAL